MVLQAGTHRVLIWKQIPWLSAAEPPCKLNTMPRGGCKEGNCSQCSPVLKRCCSESGGGLHHHGLLQHAPNTCVWVESSLKPPQTLGHPEVVLVMYRWPGAYMLLQPCLPAAAASLSFSLWLCCSFVFHRDFSWPSPLPLSKLIPFLAFCFILFSTLTACSSVSWNPLIGYCCLCVFSVGTVKACLAVGCSLHIGRLLYPTAPGGGSSDR